jgi:hypothetical protein
MTFWNYSSLLNWHLSIILMTQSTSPNQSPSLFFIIIIITPYYLSPKSPPFLLKLLQHMLKITSLCLTFLPFTLWDTVRPTFFFYFFILFVLWYWRLNSGPIPWATPPAHFCDGVFEIRSWELFAQVGFELWSSRSLASWVTRIVSVNHLAQTSILKYTSSLFHSPK